MLSAANCARSSVSPRTRASKPQAAEPATDDATGDAAATADTAASDDTPAANDGDAQ